MSSTSRETTNTATWNSLLRSWLTAAAWITLGATTIGLIALAIYLLFRMKLFSGGPLTDAELKALWAFLGVALAAVAAIIGALLTDQAGRRSEALTRETEARMILDTRAKVMELITQGEGYAPPARVAGAVATMMELGGGAITARIIRELWASNDLGTGSAVWLLDRILADPAATSDDKSAAADALLINHARLFPSHDDPQQDWIAWPEALYENWPTDLPLRVRNDLLTTCIRAMLAREPDYWLQSGAPPFDTLELATALEPDPDLAPLAARALILFIDNTGLQLWESTDEEEVRGLAENVNAQPWFVEMLEEIEPWSRGATRPHSQVSIVKAQSPLSPPSAKKR